VQHLKKTPQPLESQRPDLPPALCRIVHQMLAKDASRRFATARDLLRELRRVQIEHFGDDWPQDLPAWDSIAAEMPPDPRIALTRQLDELMKAASPRRSWRRRAAFLAVGVVAALAVGVAAAWWLLAPSSLLAEAKAAAPAVPQEKNVYLQCYRASQINTEAAWQSVIDYFPKKEYVALRAQQQLALIYLRKGEWDRAMSVFEKLANLNLDDAKMEVELKAFGLAGQCGVLSIRGKYEESNRILAELHPINDKLTSEPMRKLLHFAINRNRAKLPQQSGREWDKWLEQFHDEG
jgi:serine/threonine-protein kinase